MGHDKSQDQNQASMDRNKGMDRDDSMTGGSNDRAQRDMQQGDLTRPAQPDSTRPLDKDEHPINKNRPVQQNR